MVDVSLMEDFIEEAREHLEEMESAMLRLEENTGDMELVNTIFRQLHTIKGSADYLGMRRIGELSHALESLLETVRQGKIPVHRKIIDLLLKSRDRIGRMLLELVEVGIEYSDVDDLIHTAEEMSSSRFQMEIPSLPILDGIHAGMEADADPELVDIFLEQIQNDYREVMRIAIQMMNGEGALDLMEALEEIFESMRSSANYMNYDSLIRVYDWVSGRIRDAKSKVVHQTFSGTGFVDETLSPVLEAISTAVPDAHLDTQFGLYEEESGFNPMSLEQGGLSFEGESSDEMMSFEDLPEWFLTDESQSEENRQNGPSEPLIASLEMDQEMFLEGDDYEGSSGENQIQSSLIKDAELTAEFIEEASEHLKEIADGLLFIQDPVKQGESIHKVFRAVHTIKGLAEYLGLPPIAALCHDLEDLLEWVRQGKCEVSVQVVDLLIESKDCLGLQVQMLSMDAQSPADTGEEIILRIQKMLQSFQVAQAGGGREEIATQSEETDFNSQIGGLLEEDQDPELFEIFMDQLEDQAEEMKGWIFFPTGLTPVASLVEQCRESLGHLRYSANYMGYEALCVFFDGWIEEMGSISDPMDKLEEGTSQTHIEAIMAPRLKVIEGLLFQYGRVDRERRSVEEIIEAPSAETGAIDETVEAVNNEIERPEAWEDAEVDVLEQFVTQVTDQPFENDFGVWEPSQAPLLLPAMTNLVGKPQAGSALLYSRLQNALDLSEGALLEAEGSSKTPSDDSRINSLLHGIDSERSVVQPLEPAAQGPLKADPDKAERDPSKKKAKHTIRVDASKIDILMNQVGELVVNRSSFSQLNTLLRDFQKTLKGINGIGKQELKQMRDLASKFMDTTAAFSRVVSDLQDGIMKVRMLPVSQLFNRYPRLLHDLTHNSDKKVILEVKGEDTELDKMLIEEIADPLVHIIRNAVDHGIETIEARRSVGKSESGTVKLNAYHEGNHMVIEVSDDGRGIDVEKVKLKAREMGVLSPTRFDTISHRDAIDLITTPGFSTADRVTHTSGRGVGMDVVKRNIERLNGTLDVDSLKGNGTRFRIKIPLTLAIFHALLVKVAGETFTVPLSSVDHTLRIFSRDLDVIEGVEVLHLKDTPLPLIRLSQVLNIKTDANEQERLFVVVVSDGEKRAGLVVDELMGQEEVVIKPLEDYLQENSGFSGATILGDGRISLILDVCELMRLSILRKTWMSADI